MKSYSDGLGAQRPITSFFLLVTVSFSWAATFILIKIAVFDIPPATLVMIRLIIALATLLAWLRITGATFSAPQSNWGQYMLIALIGQAVPFFLISWASLVVSVGEIAILVATTPLFAAAISHLVHRTWPTKLTALSLAIGFIGIAGFIRLSMPTAPADNLSAHFALLIAAMSYAISGQIVARLTEGRPVVITAAVLLCAIVVVLPVSLMADQPWTIAPSALALGATVILGIVSTAAAYVAYYQLIKVSGPTFASMHHYLVPALGIALGAVYFGDTLTLQQVFCGLFILVSLALSSDILRHNL